MKIMLALSSQQLALKQLQPTDVRLLGPALAPMAQRRLFVDLQVLTISHSEARDLGQATLPLQPVLSTFHHTLIPITHQASAGMEILEILAMPKISF